VKRLMVVAGAVLLVGSMASPAVAKGASEATLEGPGLEAPLTFSRSGGPENDVNRLAEESGIFPAMFGQSPDPIEDDRPQKELGPRHTITYTVPGPAGEDELVQHIWPYAERGPVTYTPPGQPFMEGEGRAGGSMHTRGGWYQGLSSLKSILVDAGLPARAPEIARASETESQPLPSPMPGWPALAAIPLLGILVAVLIRRGRWPSAGRGQTL